MDRNKTFAMPKVNNKPKRPATTNVASTSRKVLPAKDDIANIRAKNIQNSTIISSADETIMKSETSLPNFDAKYRQIAYGKYLRAMLEDCLVDEKITREETQMDIQIGQLADRFQKTIDQLDKTNRRLKEINFVVEQKRLLDLKNQDSATFYEMTDNSKIKDYLTDLSNAEKICLDRLETKNVDFGYNQDSGHKQLLDAVNDAIDGLEEIKKHSKLDADKFNEYAKTDKAIDDLEKDRSELHSLKADFETKFPKLNEKLLMEASEKLASMINDENDEADETDED